MLGNAELETEEKIKKYCDWEECIEEGNVRAGM